MAVESRYGDTNRQPVPTQTINSTSGSGTTTQNAITSEFSNLINSSFTQNMPGFAMTALENLIGQLAGVPQLSPEDAARIAPVPIQERRGGRMIWFDPKTGNPITKTQADALRMERLYQQEQFKKGRQAGTSEEQTRLVERNQEIQRNRQFQSQYSKEAAFTDAQNLSAYFARKMMEESMPGIVRGAEGAGTSQGSMRALLTEQAAGRTAEAGAALGAQLATNYGQINNQLASVLEALTRADPNSSTAQLLQALNIAKGSTQFGTQQQKGETTKAATTTTTEQKAAEDVKLIDYDGLVNNTILQALKSTTTPQQQPGAGAGYFTVTPTKTNTTDSTTSTTQNEKAIQDNYFIDVM